jgi:hypothetical protein
MTMRTGLVLLMASVAYVLRALSYKLVWYERATDIRLA